MSPAPPSASIDPLSLPLSEIQGIGPSKESRLNQAGLFTIADLLRATEFQLHALVSTDTSLAQTAAWRRMAVFMQVDGMTTQWAEALVEGGIETLEELFASSRDDLSILFTDARNAGLIPDEPSPESTDAMITSATVLHYTGVLDLVLRDVSGATVAGADVEFAQESAETDEHGRVRLRPVPLGLPGRLLAKHADHGLLVTDEVEPSADHYAVSYLTLTLPEKGSEDDWSMLSLSEHAGDTLPVPLEERSREITLAEEDLRNNDFLRVRHEYANGDVQVASLLRSFADGEFVTYQFRVRKDRFPEKPSFNEYYVYRSNSFRKVRFTPQKAEFYRFLARVGPQLQAPAPDHSPQEKFAVFQANLRTVMEADGFRTIAHL